jgi:hypothetical protein
MRGERVPCNLLITSPQFWGDVLLAAAMGGLLATGSVAANIAGGALGLGGAAQGLSGAMGEAAKGNYGSSAFQAGLAGVELALGGSALRDAARAMAPLLGRAGRAIGNLLASETGAMRVMGANAQPLKTLPANSLTATEAAEIQAIANRHKTAIDVVGSRAAGKGRKVGSDLPVGKDSPGRPGTTRSDIDFRIDADHPQVDQLIGDLREVGNGAGRAARDFSNNPATPGGRATRAPFIRFTPGG